MVPLPQIFILLLALGVTVSILCPPPEDISPCGCYRNGPDIEVICQKVEDVELLRKGLQSLKGYRKVEVKFTKCRLGLVPSDFFKGLHIKKLFFDQCDLKGIGEEGRSALEGLEYIIEDLKVYSSFSGDNKLKFLNVSGLHSLKFLSLAWNNIEELGNEWFSKGPRSLKELTVAENSTKVLGEKAFAKLPSLQTLSLQHMKVKTLNRTMFPAPASHLDTLVLYKMGISSLPADIFYNMPSLSKVLLSENSIQRLPEETWSHIWSRLYHLDLRGSPLECDLHIEWMFKRHRPTNVIGKCVSPEARNDVDLAKVIDDKQKGKYYIERV